MRRICFNFLGRRIYSGIISNKNGTFLRNEIKKLDWNKYFDNVLGASDLDVDKPSKEIIDALLKQTEIPPSKSVWFIGDAIVDLEVRIHGKLHSNLSGNWINHQGGSKSVATL